MTVKCDPLPMCKNDLYALKNALIQGLNVNSNNISLCGETGRVTSTELINSINDVLRCATREDTFIFYFTGHGGKDCLILSEGLIDLQDLINTIERIPTKSKIAIIDSCH